MYTTAHVEYYLKVLPIKKTAKTFMYARRKLLLPKHVKGMFGKKECYDRELHVDRTCEGWCCLISGLKREVLQEQSVREKCCPWTFS